MQSKKTNASKSGFTLVEIMIVVCIIGLLAAISVPSFIRSITSGVALRDDLMQEALVHLWLMETRRPGQTPSWYLQSCKFHLQHYLAAGRSIDSAKRREGRVVFVHEAEDGEAFPEQGDSGDSVFTSVCARGLLPRALSAIQKPAVLCPDPLRADRADNKRHVLPGRWRARSVHPGGCAPPAPYCLAAGPAGLAR